MDFDLEDLTDLEQTFHDRGYADGHAHGRIHGLIEGRALGHEKGFEIWEEVGFYQGNALFWRAASSMTKLDGDSKASRTHRHANVLLDLISQYPESNATHLEPTHSAAPQSSPPRPSDTSSSDKSQVSTLDMTKIRSKYKVLCATLGVTPRLAPASTAHVGTSAPRVGDVLTKAAVSMEYDIDEDLDEHPVTKARRNKVNTIWAVDRKGNSLSDNGF